MSHTTQTCFSYSQRLRRRRGIRGGLTLIEMLAAGAIMAVALMGMVSTWMYAGRSTINIDDRAAAYQCGRMVMERAHTDGFTVTPQSTTVTVLPGYASNIAFATPNLAYIRYYDINLVDLGCNDSTAAGCTVATGNIPAGAHFEVITNRAATDASNVMIPASRPDLRRVQIQVYVYLIGPDGTPGTNPLCTLQTVLTEGGVS